jgi:hypothetical protein
MKESASNQETIFCIQTSWTGVSMRMKFTNTLGAVSFYKIVKIYPTKSHFNIDAESNEGRFNYVLADNVDNDVSFIIRYFRIENGRSIGYFSNSVKFSIK